jgi:hypothetical protein
MRFKVGDKVTVYKGRYYEQALEHGSVGIIHVISDVDWCVITFSDGYKNGYPMQDLKLVGIKLSLDKEYL